MSVFKISSFRFVRVFMASVVGFVASSVLYMVTNNPKYTAIGVVLAPLLSAVGKAVREKYSKDILF